MLQVSCCWAGAGNRLKSQVTSRKASASSSIHAQHAVSTSAVLLMARHMHDTEQTQGSKLWVTLVEQAADYDNNKRLSDKLQQSVS